MINSQTLEMISQVESFLFPDKQGTPEKDWRIQRPKRCVTTNNNKDEDNSPKNHTQNIVHQASSKKSWRINTTLIIELFLTGMIGLVNTEESTIFTYFFFVCLSHRSPPSIFNHIYQPLHSSRIWHKVNF